MPAETLLPDAHEAVTRLVSETREAAARDGLAEAPAELRYYGAGARTFRGDLAELSAYRELAWVLAARDLKVRYRQTLVGVAWAVLQPLATMSIFVVLFHWLGRTPAAEGAPYAVVALSGLVLWQLFATIVSQASQSLVANQALVTKVYFPRMILPIVSALVALVDMAIALVVLGGLMLWLGVAPSLAVLSAPVFIVMALLTAFAIAIWLSAANAMYRDVGHAVPFLLQIGFFVSPVVYESSALVPDRYRWLLALNPMVGAIDGFRWAVLGQGATAWGPIGISLSVLCITLAGGMAYFRRIEGTLTDRI